MNVEEQEKRLLDYKWHERRYSKDTCYILSTQGTEEPDISAEGVQPYWQTPLQPYNSKASIEIVAFDSTQTYVQ